MADHVVAFVVNKLGDFLLQEAGMLHGIHDQVAWVEHELRLMQCFLKDAADSKRKGDERVKHWVKQIRDITYEAEDAIDTFVLEKRRRRGFAGFINRYAPTPSELIARHQTGAKIRGIKGRIHDISASRIAYGIRNLDGTEARVLPLRRPVLPHVDDAGVVGFESDKEKIVKKLIYDDNLRRRVVSIVGTGGVGKTTLARKAYHSLEVQNNFDIRIWSSISRDYKVIDLLRKIAEKTGRIEKEQLERMDEEQLTEKLYEALKRAKYLIVMDDIWGDEVWQQIQAALPDERNGSRVMITTRSHNVARLADPSSTPYELRFLSDEESLELLLKKAFPDQDVTTCCPVELVDLGKQLAKRCGGLPLALVVTGGLLSIKHTEYSAWLRVLQTMNWQTDGKACMEILALSYEDLPCHLKSCFLYLACFPEDYEIPASRLIKLWIAEGFIPREGRGTVEDMAEGCLEELIQRCMVQIDKRRVDRSVKTCRVHDLLHDLAISEAKEDGFLAVYGTADHRGTSTNAPRRAALHCSTVDLKELNIPNLRSLLVFVDYLPNLRSGLFKLLRVIDLNGALGLKYLAGDIKGMIHLRYLGLRGTSLEKLPSSIGKLQYLETLDVRNTRTKDLPSTIWKIKTLRHVLISGGACAAGPPPLAELRNLQTLGVIRCMHSWKRGLPNLTSLRKLKFEDVNDHHGQILSTLLGKLDHLAILTVSGDSIPVEIHSRAFPDHCRLQSLSLWGWLRSRSLDAHEFPPRLTRLTLGQSKLVQDPMPTLEKLRCLRILGLSDEAYVGKEMVCSAGGFPQLQKLKLVKLNQLEDWRVEDDAMPKLSHLFIGECSALKKISKLQHLTSLQVLALHRMPHELDFGTGYDAT